MPRSLRTRSRSFIAQYWRSGSGEQAGGHVGRRAAGVVRVDEPGLGPARDHFLWSLFTGTPQPPFFWQLFLPAHLLSPLLQPPCLAQSFCLAQACLTVAQPPFSLHAFLFMQELSVPLQPPLFSHEFRPAQACFSAATLALLSPDLQPCSES